ncbi:hypothetical protein SETIT_2G338500v2 [Setaria italica]|uniref:Peptidase C1A papain C-terminal domain-containing protein n=1 Tax=Setaria italica TaxID=4555 RepID=A0A368Q650_SETIT|nr:hypothetical protein SETIT_2G338500v2 [Setaria italica]
MAVRQDAAMEGKTCDVKFSSSSLVRDYEEHTGRKISEESTANLPSDVRQETIRSLFRNKGALATSANWEGERRIKLTSCLKQASAHFHRIADFIRQGKPVVGCFRVDEEFHTLEPEEIYHCEAETEAETHGQIRFAHYVLFVGYGYDIYDEAYLVFLNSLGTGFGNNGFGRVYFDEIYKDWFYVLKAKAPAVAETGASTSSNIAQGR